MTIKHVGSNPLKASEPAASVLAAPRPKDRRKTRTSKGRSKTAAPAGEELPPSKKVARSAAVGMARATAAKEKPPAPRSAAKKEKASPGRKPAARKPAARKPAAPTPATTPAAARAPVETDRPSTRRRRRDTHLAGKPNAMNEELRQEFRGALRTSLNTEVAPVSETRLAELELRLNAMESTRGQISRKQGKLLEQVAERLDQLEGNMGGSPWFECELGDTLVGIEARLEALEVGKSRPVAGDAKELAREVGRLRDEISRRDGLQAVLWVVAACGVVMSAAQLLWNLVA